MKVSSNSETMRAEIFWWLQRIDIKKHSFFSYNKPAPTKGQCLLTDCYQTINNVHQNETYFFNYVVQPVHSPVSCVYPALQLHTVVAQAALAGQLPSVLAQSVFSPSALTGKEQRENTATKYYAYKTY